MILLIAAIPLMVLAVAIATVPLLVVTGRQHAGHRAATVPRHTARPADPDVPVAA